MGKYEANNQDGFYLTELVLISSRDIIWMHLNMLKNAFDPTNIFPYSPNPFSCERACDKQSRNHNARRFY